MELGPHRDTLVADLSGGQIKRVSLGAELLAEPGLLYIDEATSGLDAGTEARMMRLFRRLADAGRSIICITHNLDNVDQCHLALVLARGKLVYYGPPREAVRYFKVPRLGHIYDRLGERDLADWEKEFAASSLYREFVLDRLAVQPAPPPAPLPPSPSPPVLDRAPPAEKASGARRLSDLMARWPPLADRFRALTGRYLRWHKLVAPVQEQWHQLRVLTARYVELTLGDRRGLRLLLLQAPLVAAFLLLGFFGKDFREPMPIPRPLTPEERRTLHLVSALDRLLDDDRPLDAQQEKALKKVRFKVDAGGAPLDGTQALALLRSLRQQRLGPAQRKALEAATFPCEVDGKPEKVSGAELVQACETVSASRIPEKLLRIKGPVLPDREGLNPRYTYIMLFVVVMVVLWFGCNNAAKEIVKEEAIYARERAVNLRILPYLSSKFVVLSVITAFHALVLMAVLYGTLELLRHFVPGHTVPPHVHMLGYPAQLGVLVLLAMAGVALGLLLSACVSTPDRANALLPYVLIPQMILGGGILAVQGLLYYLAAPLSPVYWAYRAVHLGGAELPEGFPGHAAYADGAALPCAALVVQTVVLLALTAWFLRRKDV
jgi:hypothetical protein